MTHCPLSRPIARSGGGWGLRLVDPDWAVRAGLVALRVGTASPVQPCRQFQRGLSLCSAIPTTAGREWVVSGLVLGLSVSVLGAPSRPAARSRHGQAEAVLRLPRAAGEHQNLPGRNTVRLP